MVQPAPVAAKPGETTQPAPALRPPRHEPPAPYVPAPASEPAWIPDSRPVEFAAPAVAAAAELERLPNGGFEQTTEGWEPANAALTLVRGVEGRGVRITRASSEDNFAFYATKEFVTRRARSPYKLRAYIRSASPGMIVCLRVEEFAGGAPRTREGCQPSRAQWRRVKLQGRTTRAGSKLVVSIHVLAALGGTSFDVDSFRLGGRAVA